MPLLQQRSRKRAFVAVAVAATLVGAPAAIVVGRVTTTTPVVAEQIVAQAELARLPSAPDSARGTAQVVRTADRVVLRLSVDGMPAPRGLYQVRLFDGATTMIPLGVLTTGQTDMPVPSSIGLRTCPAADVSARRLGQREHGTSMPQGKLS